MSYRFVRVTNFYKEFIDHYYRNYPEYSIGTYQEQYERITGELMESSSMYVKNLRKLGVDAYEIITNALPLQETWKYEHNIEKNVTNKDLIIEQLKFYKPDIVWIDDFSLLSSEWKNKLLEEVPSINFFTGHHCAPFDNGVIEKLKLFDFVFTCTPCLKKSFEELGLKTYLLYHAFDTSVLDVLPDNINVTRSNFVFTGSLITGEGFHKKRIDFIEEMIKSGIEIDIYGNLESKRRIFIKIIFYHLINILIKLNLKFLIKVLPFFRKRSRFGNTPIKMYSKKLIKSAKPPVFGKQMFSLLSNTDICFNIHGDIAGKCAGNVRLFEATGLGTCLVTDWKDNINQLFEPDKEIITYKTKEECIEKVKWLIDNPEERKKIAMAGQSRTLKEHTIENRANKLNEIFIEIMN